ncbi:flagellar biosynthesis anti-sigma factor FlgM [Helicobacter himalayensis]|uniref:flagellar biosynthesis anti-sigma factor FlgM n=1 Tax=Helicobacter himalayensis TaxID=1591088 RepID=UPI000831B78A|nr:flagellar biosynthesis anti-sigma factor FlgM [Helicobacter himalayensis]
MITGINANFAATNSLQGNKDLQRAYAQNAETSENNTLANVANASADKVSQIKEQIANGSYKLDMDKTSRKMAQDLLNI